VGALTGGVDDGDGLAIQGALQHLELDLGALLAANGGRPPVLWGGGGEGGPGEAGQGRGRQQCSGVNRSRAACQHTVLLFVPFRPDMWAVATAQVSQPDAHASAHMHRCSCDGRETHISTHRRTGSVCEHTSKKALIRAWGTAGLSRP
jgi:hypothetical protein